MAEVRWTPQAGDDLDVIADFIAEDSPHYASLFVIDVLAAVERLEAFPRSGRIVPEANDPILREIILGDYRIGVTSRIWPSWPSPPNTSMSPLFLTLKPWRK